MLMFKDKLKVSDLGYQLEGKEEGNMFSCKLGGEPFAACVCSQSSPGSARRLQPGPEWAGEKQPDQSLSHGPSLLPHCSFPQPAVEGSMPYLDSQFSFVLLVWKTGGIFIF